jgi:mRNA interferase RelE/StbE
VTAGYRVEIARRALKSLQALPRAEQQRVRAAIELLADTPRPPGCVALKGETSAYRVRVGNYRVVYEIHDRRLLIQVVRIGHRRQVYR